MSFGFATTVDCCCFCCQQCVIPGNPPKQTLCGETGVGCTTYSATVAGFADGTGGTNPITGLTGACQQCENFNGTYILDRFGGSVPAGLTSCSLFKKFFPFAANIPCYNYNPPYQIPCGGRDALGHEPNQNPNPGGQNYGISIGNLFMCNASPGDPYGKYYIQCLLALRCQGISDGTNTGFSPVVYRYYYNSIPQHCDSGSWVLKPGFLDGFLPPPYKGFIFMSDPQFPVLFPTANPNILCTVSSSTITIKPA